MQMVRSHGGDGPADHNPFINSDPTQGQDQDILDQWEIWFDEMDKNDIVIYLFFYDDDMNSCSSGLGWCMQNGELHPTEKVFIEEIVNRYEHHKNIIWITMEEYQEDNNGDDIARHSKLAETIRNADDNNHPIAVHQLSGLTFDFPDDPNVDQFSIQWKKSTPQENHNDMVTAWNNAAGRFNLNLAEPINTWGTGKVSRDKLWAIATGGAYVMPIAWDIASTSVADLTDCGVLKGFFESTDLLNLAPHDELAFGGTQWVLANPGNSYIAYTSSLIGDMGISGMTAGTYDFTWLDIPSGVKVEQTGVSVSAGDQSRVKPFGIGNELAVYIRR
ncbi:DUF4038 domain-containing protein [Candidatus Woesearchaeota archaeon]|nr:DUF4038 domain-containing protein [Candidatus Woesearchaeota archaeon]